MKIDLGKRDLQQFVEALIRFRAEYLYFTKKHNKINFNYTSGFHFRYDKWREGNKIAFNGGKVNQYLKPKSTDDNY